MRIFDNAEVGALTPELRVKCVCEKQYTCTNCLFPSLTRYDTIFYILKILNMKFPSYNIK